MASIEEVLQAAASSEEEKAAVAEAAKTVDGMLSYLAAHGCDATRADLETFAREKVGELSDEELEAVAGGWDITDTMAAIEWAVMSLSVAGCAYLVADPVVTSIVKGKTLTVNEDHFLTCSNQDIVW